MTSHDFPNPKELTLPLIHLNGSSAARLAAAYKKALDAAETLEEALREIDHNQRDYYPLGPDAWPKARSEFCSALTAMQDVK